MAQNIKDYLHLYPKVPIAICEPNTEPVSHYLEGIDWYLDKVIAERVNYPFERIKPILRPLSDMTREEHVYMMANFPSIDNDTNIPQARKDAIKAKWLLSKHFDIFGLHNAGLCYYKNENNELY